MVILFDHGTPRGIARALQGHTVKEARAQGWDTLNNGNLLRAAEEAGFDVLLTTDTNLPHQQIWKAANWRSWFSTKTGGASQDARERQSSGGRKTRNLHCGYHPSALIPFLETRPGTGKNLRLRLE